MSERKRKQLDRMIQAYVNREYPNQNVGAYISQVETDYAEDTEMFSVNFYREDKPEWGFQLKVFAYRSDKPLFILGMLAQAIMDRQR